MAKRRGNREGTVFKDSNGRWRGQITLENGQRMGKTFETQKEALAWLRELRHAQALGVVLGASKLTMLQFLDRWYEDVAAHTLRPKTLQGYRQLLEQHIKPEIGKIPLTSLRPDHLQRLYSKKLDAGLSNRTVQFIHAILHKSLGQAVKWGLTARNVADAVEPPKVRRKAPTTLSPEQVKRLLEVLQGDRWYALYLLAVATGMRQGEILGLLWEDVDLDRGSLRIRRALQVLIGQGIVETTPKSEKSRRLVLLPQVVVAALKEHRERQQELKNLAGGRWREVGLVFTTNRGTPISSRNLVRHFKGVLQRAGLPDIRFHDLRHTTATLLFLQGAHPKQVQELLGHSQITLTLDTYSHILPDIQADTASKMNRILSS